MWESFIKNHLELTFPGTLRFLRVGSRSIQFTSFVVFKSLSFLFVDIMIEYNSHIFFRSSLALYLIKICNTQKTFDIYFKGCLTSIGVGCLACFKVDSSIDIGHLFVSEGGGKNN
jgi:hypothetical protein